MSTEHYTKFRGVEHYGKPSLINELETNLKSYLDWSFLQIGAWENVTSTTSGPFGGNYYQLHEVNDRNYPNNTVFQAIRKDWVYETGVNYVAPDTSINNPLDVQVYVDNVAVSTGTAGATHHINYPLGRIIFDDVQSENVKAEYSFRAVQVYIADDFNWWFELQYDSQNPADSQWAQNIATGGDYSLAGTNRMQLPAIVIEPIIRTSSKPFEIGSLSRYQKQDVSFHVISQDRFTRNNLTDYLRLQEEKTIILYDSSKLYNSNLFPLDERGMKVASPAMYPSIVNNSALVFNTARFEKIYVSEVKTHHPNLHWSIVRATVEIIA